MKAEVRGYNGYDSDAASKAAALRFEKPSRTQQSHKEDADINVIVKRFKSSGMVPQKRLPPEFGDFTGVVSYQDAQNRIRAAQEAFDALPWQVRARFNNSPGAFVEFATDEANIDEWD